MTKNDINIFYIPLRYLHRVRLKTWPKVMSWWLLMVLPTIIFFFGGNTSAITNLTVISYIILLGLVVIYYELGYIYNDVITTQKETNPTIRLSEKTMTFGRQHIIDIFLIRLLMVCVLMIIFGMINHWTRPTIITLIWAILLQPIFLLYNSIRGTKAVLFYPILVSWRYLVFIWMYVPQETWKYACFLLLLSYPLEICIERFSMPQHRYPLIRSILPSEEAKQRFRVLYYFLASIISFIIIYFYQLPIIWGLPCGTLFIYRLIVWLIRPNLKQI